MKVVKLTVTYYDDDDDDEMEFLELCVAIGLLRVTSAPKLNYSFFQHVFYF